MVMPKCIYCFGQEDAVAVLNYGEGRYCHIGINCLKNKVFMHKWIMVNDDDLSHPFITDALYGACIDCKNLGLCHTTVINNLKKKKWRWCAGFAKKIS